MTLGKDVHLKNVPISILEIDDGMDTFWRDVHSLKAYSPILLIELGKLNENSLTQRENAALSICWNESG